MLAACTAAPLAIPPVPCVLSLASGELHTLVAGSWLIAGLACVAAKIEGSIKLKIDCCCLRQQTGLAASAVITVTEA